MGRRILLTGGTGALGPHLVSELLVGGPANVVHVLIRPDTETLDRRFETLKRVVRSVVEGPEPGGEVGLDRRVLLLETSDARISECGQSTAAP